MSGRSARSAPAREERLQSLQAGRILGAAALELSRVVDKDRQLRHGRPEPQGRMVGKGVERGTIGGARLLASPHLGEQPGELHLRLEIARAERNGAAQIIQSFPLRLGRAQAHAEMKAGGGILGIDRKRGAQAVDRLLGAAGAAQHAAERAVRGGEPRIEPRRPLGERDRRRPIAAPPEGEAELQVRHGVAGRKRDHLAEAVHRLAEPLRAELAMASLPAQEVAQRPARRDQGRVEPYRRAQVLARTAHVAATAHEMAQLIVSACIGGIERERAAIGGGRLLAGPGRLQGVGELAVKHRVAGRRPHQRAKER
jgi:hypothetical protein